MSDISNTIRLNDQMSDPLKKISGNVDKLVSQLEQLSDVNKNAADPSPVYNSTADSLSNLFAAAGGYKVMQMVGSAFKESASAAIEFESAITGVYKTVDGTKEQLAQLGKDVRAMALDMPSTTTEIASVMESAGQLGIATDNVTDFAKTMIDLGNATNLTADQAASSLAKFANITGMSADNYRNLGSVIVDLGNNFATTEQDIVNMSTYLTSAASVAGFAETDILALSAAMSSVGINAEAGGSSMSKLISEMQTAVEVGGEGLQSFADVAGMTAQQFADEWGTNAVGALQAFIVGLNDVERNGKSMSVILQDLDLDDIRMSNMLKAMAQGSDVMTSAVSRANTAWQENTALTNEVEKRYATLESKMQMMQNAANDLKISIGNALTPALSGLTGAATGALKGLSSFADENQALTAGIMGTVGSAGALAAGFMTVVPAISAVKTAWKALDTTMSLSKIGLVLGGISVAVGTIAWLKTAFSNAEDAVEDYNGTLEECRNEIEQTRTEYKAVVSMYGEQSSAAQRAAGELNTLNKQYEQGGGAAADYAQRVSKTAESIRSLSEKYDDSVNSIDNSYNSGLVAVSMLKQLSSQSQITNDDLDAMSKYADYLNDTFHCNIVVDYEKGKLIGFDPTDSTQVVIDIAEQKKKDAALTSYTSTETQTEFKAAWDQYNESNKQMLADQKAYEDAKKQYEISHAQAAYDQKRNNAYGDKWSEWSENSKFAKAEFYAMQEYIEAGQKLYGSKWQFGAGGETIPDPKEYSKEEIESGAAGSLGSQQYAVRTYNDIYGKMKDWADASGQSETFSGYIESLKETGEAEIEATESVSNYASEVASKLADVREAYNETYDAAIQSIRGQFGLFDEAAVNAEMSADKFINAQKKQAQYWNEYADNINAVSQYTAQELGVSEEAFAAFKVKITDHSQESVALAHEMANGSTESAKQIVQAFETTYKAEQNAAQATSEWQSGLSATVSKTVTDTLTSVDSIINGINSNAGAFSTAGTNVGNAFTAALSLAMNGAISAAQTVTNSVQSILNSIHVSVPKVNSPSDIKAYFDGNGYATGTLNAAPGLALVGEKGPELINFGGGEVVYTAAETRRMISDVYIPSSVHEALGMEHSIGGLSSSGYYTTATPKEEDELKLSDSDREYLIALGERSAVNSAASNDIKIEMVNNNNISSEADVDGIIDHLARGLQNALAMTAEGVHK